MENIEKVYSTDSAGRSDAGCGCGNGGAFAVFAEIFSGAELLKAVFGNPRKKSLPYKKVTVKPLLIKGLIEYQFEYSFEKKVTHENLRAPEAEKRCAELLTKEFKQLNIYKKEEEVQVLAAKPDKPRITRKAKKKESSADISHTKCETYENADGKISKQQKRAIMKNASILTEDSLEVNSPKDIENIESFSTADLERLSHNRKKNYIIPDGSPCDFLIRLGVMDKDGKVFQKHYGKFRQINRYLEIVRDVLPYLKNEADDLKEDSSPKTNRPLKIIDFGCGKAYLTFALYHYLKIMQGFDVEIIGLDLKDDVIKFCGNVASDLGYEGLTFLRGDIADYTADSADMVVTLHACDTATDYALINAVNWHSKVILSVPCCQHELFSQIKDELLSPLLKHGIIKDRFTEILTDGIRGLALESAGYDVAMIEFTSLEHTARNIMIKAVRTRARKAKMDKARAEYEALKEAYHIEPTIDRMFR